MRSIDGGRPSAPEAGTSDKGWARYEVPFGAEQIPPTADPYGFDKPEVEETDNINDRVVRWLTGISFSVLLLVFGAACFAGGIGVAVLIMMKAAP